MSRKCPDQLVHLVSLIGTVSDRAYILRYPVILLEGKKALIEVCECVSSRDELHKASVTERFVALRYATVRHQQALRGAS